MQLEFSFIIPVYNRPDEINELLDSFTKLNTAIDYEIVIIEDGSTLTSKSIIEDYNSKLNIAYYYKDNTGPGDSRNYGMQHAKGNYFIILDSDCILPKEYLNEVVNGLETNYVDCFGGPDSAHKSFSNLQKAINFTMTSFITTGGIRGHKNNSSDFQPRSFNMGISKEAFLKSKGFGNIHPGEDPDLSIRLNKLGFKTALIPNAFVYHKRRVSWSKFYTQVYKFGLVRAILNKWHPESRKITYWFPTLFSFGFLVAVLLLLLNIKWLLWCYIVYFVLVFFASLFSTKSLHIAILSLVAVCIQFFGYGYGYLKSTFVVQVLKKKPEQYFQNLFFKST